MHSGGFEPEDNKENKDSICTQTSGKIFVPFRPLAKAFGVFFCSIRAAVL